MTPCADPPQTCSECGMSPNHGQVMLTVTDPAGHEFVLCLACRIKRKKEDA